MKLVTGVGIAAGVIVIASVLFPGLRGPFNRVRNEANEKLEAEYVVDNYKAEYVKLHEKSTMLARQINTYVVEQRCAERKLDNARKNVDTAKQKLIDTGTSNMQEFMRAKSVYESFCAEVQMLESKVKLYTEAVAKLEKSRVLVETSMAKAKAVIDKLVATKTMTDTVKSVNEIVESITGLDNDNITTINIEKLNDEFMRESIKLDTLSADQQSSSMTEAEAQAYINDIKKKK